MLAWEVHAGLLTLENVNEPIASSSEELTLSPRYMGICGSDRPKLLRPTKFKLPDRWRPGHELVGTDSHGNWFCVDPLIPCGKCSFCSTENSHCCEYMKRVGWDVSGGFAEFLVVPKANAYLLPPGLNPLCAVLADPMAVAIHGFANLTFQSKGMVGIIGAGTIGMLSAAVAAEMGHDVTLIHRDEHKPSKTVRQMFDFRFCAYSGTRQGPKYDLVIDAASGHSAEPLKLALELVRNGGTIVVQNAYHPNVELDYPLRDIFRRSIHIAGSFSYKCGVGSTVFQQAINFLTKNVEALSTLACEVGELSDLKRVISMPQGGPQRQVLVAR